MTCMLGTIITTKSGKVFPKDENDWQFLYSEVPGKLNDAYEKHNFKIVFFTNQKGISNGKQPLKPFQNKIEAIAAKIRAPLQVCHVSTFSSSLSLHKISNDNALFCFRYLLAPAVYRSIASPSRACGIYLRIRSMAALQSIVSSRYSLATAPVVLRVA